MKLLTFGRTITGILSGLGLLMASCADESPWGSQDGADGKIFLNLTADGNVLLGTRASDNESPLIPGANEFSISLESNDGTYKKTWETLDAFNNEDGFPLGTYKITASYGKIDQEGFTNPYFYGEAPVTVSMGSEANVRIEAKLANAMVSVRFTDQLKGFYTNHSATTQSEGMEKIVFVENENRPAYVKPGMVSLSVTLTRDGSQTVTVKAAEFRAKPQTHVIATIGIEGDVENQQGLLSVEFQENVESEIIPIPLTDELFVTEKPEVKAEGFISNSVMNIIQYINDPDLNPEFHVFAFGGIQEAMLNISASNGGVLPPFGASVDLMDESKKSQIESSGLIYGGFTGTESGMAIVNFKDFITSLAPGDYDITLVVTDKLNRKTDDEELIHLLVKVSPVGIQIVDITSPLFFTNSFDVTVSSNSPLAKNQITFKAKSEDGAILTDVNYSAVRDGASTDNNYQYIYTVNLNGNEKFNDSEWKVRASLTADKYDEKVFDVIMPNFKIETDALATKVKIRIDHDNPDIIDYIVKEADVVIFNNDNKTNVKEASISRTGNIITISDLLPSTPYSNYGLFLGSTVTNNYSGNQIPSFTTENAAEVPNGNFISLGEPLSINPIKIGGQFNVNVWPFDGDYQNTSSINRDVPADWATINDYTCYKNASNVNTWFTVPSTFLEGNTCIIRSVGYHHNGKTPTKSGGYMNREYYCENIPEELKTRAGELFLGSYSFDGEEHRINGIEFTSRPSNLSFEYKYNSKNSEVAGVMIRILNSNDEEISKNNIQLSHALDFSTKTIILPDYEFGSSAVKIEIRFISTDNTNTPYVDIPQGKDLDEGVTNIRESNGQPKQLNPNTYKAVAIGSELQIRNIKLNY